MPWSQNAVVLSVQIFGVLFFVCLEIAREGVYLFVRGTRERFVARCFNQKDAWNARKGAVGMWLRTTGVESECVFGSV